MTEMGHGPALRLTEASGRCRLGQATFAGTDGKGREAPILIVRRTSRGRRGSGRVSDAGPAQAGR